MDEKLHIVQHLFGEGEDETDLRRMLEDRMLEDEALREEYEALAEVKMYLDQRTPERPDPAVIDRIMAAAGAATLPVSRASDRALRARQDRAARPGAARRYRIIGTLSAALAVVLAVAVGLDQYRDFTRTEASQEFMAAPTPSHQDADTASDADAVDEAAPLAPSGRVRAQGAARKAEVDPEPVAPASSALAADALTEVRASREATEEEEAKEAMPAWDEADELLRVHRRIEMLRARSMEGIWDESEVMSLDSMPPQQPIATPLNPASTHPPDGH